MSAPTMTPIPLPPALAALVDTDFTGPLTLHVRKGVIMVIEYPRRLDLAREVRG